MNSQWSRILIWLLSCCMFSSIAMADAYNKGVDAFKDGEYAKAYKILSGAVKKAKDKTDKAEAMAMMGAAAAKLGKKSKAESLFGKALKLDSEVSLSKDAVKDKAVRKLFAKAKKGGGGGDDDEGGGGGGGDEGDDGFGLADKGDKGEKAERGEKSSGRKTGAKALIPFGIGFFMGGETTKGLLYGAAQLAGGIGYVAAGLEIDKAEKAAIAYGDQAVADQAAGTPPDDTTLKYLDDNAAYVKKTQQVQGALGILFAASYGIGVLDGLFFGGKKKASKKRAEIIDDTGHVLVDNGKPRPFVSEDIEEYEARPWEMKVQLLPERDAAVMLSINHGF